MSERTDQSYHAALASHTRRQVLDALAAAAEPRDAHSLSVELGLHVTTVRFHLDQLEAARLVKRSVVAEKRRGRPRTLYVAVELVDRDENSREQLIEVLAGALAERDPDDGRGSAVDAGRAWGRQLERGRSEPAEGRGALLDVLDELGFEPQPQGDTVHLLACPFRDAARQNPGVVCSVHRGLIQQILDTDGTVRNVRLLPFVQPDLCVITMN